MGQLGQLGHPDWDKRVIVRFIRGCFQPGVVLGASGSYRLVLGRVLLDPCVARADYRGGALLTSHIAPGRRTLAPSRCAASASRRDAMAAETTSAGWLRSQLLTAPIWVD